MSSILLLVLVLGYFSVLQLIALWGRKDSSNTAFFLGNRTSPWYIVAFGMIGASLSGVSFVSVPGWVATSGFSYMQMVIGFSLGYIVVAKLLLPIYYRLQVTSIYEYLASRFGTHTYKTGTLFFIASRTIGGATRLFIVSLILHTFIFAAWGVPFVVSAGLLLLLIYLYTFTNGIKTIVWTDALQTSFLISSLLLLMYQSMQTLSFDVTETVRAIYHSPLSDMWVFDDLKKPSHFVKMFLSGIFITIAMTGLDQDMMQKNLSCKNLKSAQKNMYSYGAAFIPMNALFLALGVLLIFVAEKNGIALPSQTDSILPSIIVNGILGSWAMVFFLIGIIAATFSSADSALISLTTAMSVDIVNIQRFSEQKATRIRRLIHIGFCIVFLLLIMVFWWIDNKNILDLLFTIASYTYGPLLGIFAYGIFTKWKLKDRLVPFVAIISPIIAYGIKWIFSHYYEYQIGYELLILNGMITFIGLLCLTNKKAKLNPITSLNEIL